ncbi:MAG: prolyl oligopeptidase family serine peptidase, partial [Bdellovibrionota bacterium]
MKQILKIITSLFFLTTLNSACSTQLKPPPSSKDIIQRLNEEEVYANTNLKPLNSNIRAIKSYLTNFNQTLIEKTNGDAIIYGDYEFSLKHPSGRYHPVVYRKLISSEHPAEEVLDIQDILKEYFVTGLHNLKISNDGKQIAIVASTQLHGERSLYLVNLETSKLLFLRQNINQAEFSKNSKQLFFIERASLEPKRVWKYSEQKTLKIFQANPKSIITNLSKSQESEPYFIVRQSDRNELYYLIPEGFQLISNKASNYIENPLLQIKDKLIIVEDKISSQQLCIYSETKLTKETCLKENFRDGLITDIFSYQNNLQVIFRTGTNYELLSYNLHGRLLAKYNFQKSRIHSSLIKQRSIKGMQLKISRYLSRSYDFILDPEAEFKSPESEKFVTEGLCSIDKATKVPVSFISNNLNAAKALVVEIYSSYGKTALPRYRPELNQLIQNNISTAIVHARGSAYWGINWHNSARKAGKSQTFNDLVTCLKYFKQQAPKRKIILKAKSAGGLFAANAATKFPELVDLLILDAPFLNPLEILSDPNQDFWDQDVLEWGEMRDEKFYKTLSELTPNLKPNADFPDTVIFARADDKLVQIDGILNWLTTSRIATANKSKFLLILSLNGG